MSVERAYAVIAFVNEIVFGTIMSCGLGFDLPSGVFRYASYLASASRSMDSTLDADVLSTFLERSLSLLLNRSVAAFTVSCCFFIVKVMGVAENGLDLDVPLFRATTLSKGMESSAKSSQLDDCRSCSKLLMLFESNFDGQQQLG